MTTKNQKNFDLGIDIKLNLIYTRDCKLNPKEVYKHE
nr:MAG TPA: hypothetical protein [Caudoviricetes sp.]